MGRDVGQEEAYGQYSGAAVLLVGGVELGDGRKGCVSRK